MITSKPVSIVGSTLDRIERIEARRVDSREVGKVGSREYSRVTTRVESTFSYLNFEGYPWIWEIV